MTWLTVASMFLCVPALADARTDAEVLATRAKALFHAKSYAQAADLYLAAYAKSHVPLMLFNAARATEEAGNLAEARALFLEYARLEGITPAERKDALRRADDLRVRLDQQAPVAAEPAPKPKNAPAADPATPPAPSEPAKAAATQPPSAPQPAKRDEPAQAGPAATPPVAVQRDRAPRAASGAPVWPIVAAASATAASVALWWMANDKSHQANGIDVRDQASKQNYLTLADSARTWQKAAIGAGAVAGALAVWAIAAGVSSPTAPRSTVRWLPILQPDGAGLAAQVGW
ncbi:MAG: hypothetical protein HY902_12695 [Deltaproteobacteria bacterium]|nr:hypothetical protein [Deltaproteobacteria bacterium]